VVITKDRDFRDSHLLRSSPRRLLVVSALEKAAFVELWTDRLIVHGDRS
jgi:hypothetical protein